MAAKPPLTEEQIQRIKDSTEAGRGKSMFDVDDPTELDRLHRVQCRCGVPRKPPGLAKHVQDDGICPAHPDKPPQPWTRGVTGEDKGVRPTGDDAAAAGRQGPGP